MPKKLVVRLANKQPIAVFTFLLVSILILLSSCDPKELVVTDGYVELNGSEVYYKIIGSGEPLIIVHGGPVLDHSYLLPHLETLANDFQLIFYDQRATGRSSIEIDSSSMNLMSFVDDIELLRQSLGLGKINVLGHSWGGLMAMVYGAKYSQNLNHLILSNSIAANVDDWNIQNAAVANLQTEQDRNERQKILDGFKDEKQGRLGLINELLMAAFRTQMYERDNLEKLILYLPDDYEQRSQTYQLLGPEMNSFNFDEFLSRIDCPTLIIYGDLEPAVELYADKIVGQIEGARLEVIGQSGHFPFIEQPARFTETVLSFLNN